ncbi:MAG: hypothetical protein ACI8Y4_005264 [Candidatus Poriferisodalaceae bacterium]
MANPVDELVRWTGLVVIQGVVDFVAPYLVWEVVDHFDGVTVGVIDLGAMGHAMVDPPDVHVVVG